MKTPTKRHHPSLAFVLGALLAALPASYAADSSTPPPPPEARRERMEKAGERMAEELGLTDDQKAKWKAIGQQEKSELDALRDNTALTKDDRHAKAGEIRKKYKDQRDAILTPEQKAKAEKMREHFEKRREERKDGDKPVEK